jgi:hypothetical protein
MPSSGRSKGKKQHSQLVHRNGDTEIVDTNEKDLVARHNVVVDKLKARWAKQEAEFKAEIEKCHQTDAQLRTEIDNLNNKKHAATSSGGRESEKKQKPIMKDAVRGQVEAVCKSQLCRVSKFICSEDHVVREHYWVRIDKMDLCGLKTGG